MLESESRRAKLVLVGEHASGKTSLLHRFVERRFTPHSVPTVGVEFATRSVYVDTSVVRLQMWDTAGQERFRALLSSFIRDAALALVVYDVTRERTFLEVPYWVEYVRTERGSDAYIVLVANKCDCERVVSRERGEGAASHHRVDYAEVSALSGEGCQRLLDQVARRVISDHLASPRHALTLEEGARERDELPRCVC